MTKPKKKAAVLFVCMGNICRSPLAEGAFRHAVSHFEDMDIVVDSAGTHRYHVGDPPDPRAIAAAKRRSIDIAGLRARAVSSSDFERFDLIVAMDHDNHALLSQRFPTGLERLRLFMQYANEAGADVPDPYYGGPEGFELVLDLIDRGTGALLTELRRMR